MEFEVEIIPSVSILVGDALEKLRELPDESVQCCVTSPPYWGLRDYGTASWEGGESDCDHRESDIRMRNNLASAANASDGGNRSQSSRSDNDLGIPFRDSCGKCGAKRIDSQLGLEKTPEQYVAKMVEVFREVRRVLRKDGTLWLNLGDSYNGQGARSPNIQANGDLSYRAGGRAIDVPGLKPKDLCGIPWRVAFALQSDGWYLRQDIIWAKPNPMPESVTDRCTKSHEYLFLFSKGDWTQRTIKFSDLPDEFVHFVHHGWEQVTPMGKVVMGSKCVALAAALLDCSQRQYDFRLPPFYNEVWEQFPDGDDSSFVSSLPMKHRAAVYASRFLASQCSTKSFLQQLHRFLVDHPAAYHFLKAGIVAEFADTPHIYCDGDGSFAVNESGQICKFDLVHGQIITAKPSGCQYFYDAEAIAEPLAYGSIERLSQDSLDQQHGSDRVPFKTNGAMKAVYKEPYRNQSTKDYASGKAQDASATKARIVDRILSGDIITRNKRSVWTVTTQSYPGAHFATYPPDLIKPCIMASTRAGDTVIDPFAGSGTTGMVSLELGRKAILIELNPKYVKLIEQRCDVTVGLPLV